MVSEGKFIISLHPCQFLLWQGHRPCNKLQEVTLAMQDVGKSEFCAGCPALALEAPSLAPGVPLRLCCFLSAPWPQQQLLLLLRARPVLLGKIPISFIFLVYVHTQAYTYVYIYSSILYIYVQCLHIGMYFKITRNKFFTIKSSLPSNAKVSLVILNTHTSAAFFHPRGNLFRR